jgi:hypothetical protein
MQTIVAYMSYLAFGLDAEDPPFKSRPWQIREYVCNESADVQLRRERIKRITVQANSNVVALQIQAKQTIPTRLVRANLRVRGPGWAHTE